MLKFINKTIGIALVLTLCFMNLNAQMSRNSVQQTKKSNTEFQAFGEKGYVVPANRTIILSEGFESGIPSTWFNLDVDGDGFTWAITCAGAGYTWPGHNSAHSVGSGSWIDPPGPGNVNPNNWLITPQLNVSGATLTYWVAVANWAYPAEKYQVLVSTTTPEPANFTVIHDETLTAAVGEPNWALRTFDLSAYSGNIYIAFRNYGNNDMFTMMIDDVLVVNAEQPDDCNPVTNFNVAYNDDCEAVLTWDAPGKGKVLRTSYPDKFDKSKISSKAELKKQIMKYASVTKPETVKPNSRNLVYYEHFEDAPLYGIPDGWVGINLSPTGEQWEVWDDFEWDPYAGGGAQFAACLYPDMGDDNDAWLISTAMNLTAGKTYEVSFWTIIHGDYPWDYDQFEVKIGTSQTVAGMTELLYYNIDERIEDWELITVNFVPSISGTYYLGFHNFTADCEGLFTAIDNIAVTEITNQTLYNIYRNEVLVKANHTETTYTDSGFDIYTGHTWEITVVCEAGVESDPVSEVKTECKTTNPSDCEEYSTPNGNVAQYWIPINCYYGNNYTQIIYEESEIGVSGGYITSLSLQCLRNDLVRDNVSVWIGHTTKSVFANNADWELYENLQEVFSGQLQLVGTISQYEWLEIPFHTPFTYNGGNIVVAFLNQQGNNGNGTANTFYTYNVTGVKCINHYWDGSATINPANPPDAAGTQSMLQRKANIKFLICPLETGDCEAPTNLDVEYNGNCEAILSWDAPAKKSQNLQTYPVKKSTTRTSKTLIGDYNFTPFTNNTEKNNQVSANNLSKNVIFSEGFEGGIGAWTEENNSNSDGWILTPNVDEDVYPHSGNYCAGNFYSGWNHVRNVWLFSPGINLTSGTKYTISFWLKLPGWPPDEFDYFELKIGNAAASTSMNVTPLYYNTTIHIPEWTLITATFTPASSGNYYLGFHSFTPMGDGDFILIDDISVTENDSNDDILYNIYRNGTLVQADHPATTYTDMGFDPYSGHIWEVKVACAEGGESLSAIKIMEACIPFGDCDPVTNFVVEYNDDCEALLTWDAPNKGISKPLSHNSNIDKRNGEKDIRSEKISKADLRLERLTRAANSKPTMTAPKGVILFEDFEDANVYYLPDGWTEASIGYGWWWFVDDSYWNAYSGEQWATCWFDDEEDKDAWMFSPGISMTAGETYTISFWAMMGYNPTDGNRFEVKIAQSPTIDAMTNSSISVFHTTNGYYNDWTQITYNFTPTVSGTYYLGFHDFTYLYDGLDTLIDDVMVTTGGSTPSEILYNIYRNDVLVKSNHTETTYTDSSFDVTVGHTWSVRVVCETGGESVPAEASLTACDPIPQPYITPNTALEYTFDDLVTHSNGTVKKVGDIYVMRENVTISELDALIVNSDITVKIFAGKVLKIDGSRWEIDAPNQAIFTNNATGEYYATILVEEGSYVRLNNATFTYGSGIRVIDSDFEMDYCTMSYHNFSSQASGAISTTRGKMIVKNSTFTNNVRSAFNSAANIGCTFEIINCYLENNVTENTNRPQINVGPARAGETTKIIGCTIIGNRSFTNVGAVSTSSLLGVATNSLVENNYMKDNRYGITFTGANINGIIKGNTLIDNNVEVNPMMGGSGINITGSAGNVHAVITENIISGHHWGITLVGNTSTYAAGPTANIGNIDVPQDHPEYNIGKNIFSNNGNGGQWYDLFNNNPNDVMAQNNNWGVPEQTEDLIRTVIRDKFNDERYGTVTFMPPYIIGDDECNPPTNLEVIYTEYCNAVLTWDAPVKSKTLPKQSIVNPLKNIDKNAVSREELKRMIVEYTTATKPVTVKPKSKGTVFFEDFEDSTVGETPNGWVRLNLSPTGSDWAVWNHDYIQGPFAGDQHVGCILPWFEDDNDAWLFSPGMTLTAGAVYEISFWAIIHGYADWAEYDLLEVKIGTAQTVAGMTNLIYYNVDEPVEQWELITVTFTPTVTGTYYLGFHNFTRSMEGIFTTIDDVTVTAPFYNIYRDDILIKANHAANTYIDSGFDLSTGHTWSVTAVCDEDAESDAVSFTLEDGCTPLECYSAENFEGEYTDDCKAILTWQAPAEGEFSYNIFRNWDLIATVTTEYFVDDDFNPKEGYVWAVTVICALNSESDFVWLEMGPCDNENIKSNVLNSITLYPNPTSGQLRITNYELQITNVQIYDVSGRNVFGYTVNGTRYTEIANRKSEIVLDISDLPAGVYFVRVGNEMVKVVKK